MYVCYYLLAVGLVCAINGSAERIFTSFRALDAKVPPKSADSPQPYNCQANPAFRYKWVALGGEVHETNVTANLLEVSATPDLTEEAHQMGSVIVGLVTKNMPTEVFTELTKRGSVGLFTKEETTTIFPEYCHLADRPECEGTCAGACSDTCTGDGRKYDSLAGLGGERATCLDDNFMCTPDDPYRYTDNILVHEFAHTIHQYALPYADPNTNWFTYIYNAWLNARRNEIWDINSYAMYDQYEYFAEATGVFFNVNHHYSSSGGMNSCGTVNGFCQTEVEARAWLKQQDPTLYTALEYTYTNNDDSLPSGLKICMTQP